MDSTYTSFSKRKITRKFRIIMPYHVKIQLHGTYSSISRVKAETYPSFGCTLRSLVDNQAERLLPDSDRPRYSVGFWGYESGLVN